MIGGDDFGDLVCSKRIVTIIKVLEKLRRFTFALRTCRRYLSGFQSHCTLVRRKRGLAPARALLFWIFRTTWQPGACPLFPGRHGRVPRR